MSLAKFPGRKSMALWSAALLPFLATGCATVPVPGASSPITQKEAQQGQDFHPKLLSEFGGTYQGPQVGYVEQIGRNIAVRSGLGNAHSDFTVSMLNSPVNNAFAIPGGYIYTTRQLVALMNDEAELAAVLGHEVGHVAARHAQRRQNNAQRNTLLGAAGAILSGILLGDSSIGNTLSRGLLQGSQLLTLKFSRSQELEADELGIQYLHRGGYDPTAMASVLRSLALQNQLDASLQGRDNANIPEWASTHPDPASRVRTATARAGAATGTRNRDAFLNRIDGMLYGDDPKQGIVEGRRFTHPDLRLTFTVPQGFYLVNGTRAVSINGQSGKAQFSTAAHNGDLNRYVTKTFAALGGRQQVLRPASIKRTTVNGIPVAYGTARVTSGGSQVDVAVYAYEFSKNSAFHFATISQAGRASTFSPMVRSLRKISANEAAKIVPKRIDVVTVGRGDTVRSLSNRMAFDQAKEQRFRVLNGLGRNDSLRAGQKVKIIVRER